MTDGRVRRGYLGIAGGPRPVPAEAREHWGGAACVEIVEVVQDTPAAVAGLRAGDLLVELAGRRIASVSDVQRVMEDDVVATRVVATVLRAGLERRLTIVPVELGR
jgi:S1-C subfamily serine protease